MHTAPALDSHTVREAHALLLRRAQRLVRPQEAPDLVQEVWVAAFATLDRYEGRASLHTWLTSILRHKAADRYRSARHRREVLSSFERAEPAAESRVVESCAARDALGEVAKKLDRLDARSQAIVLAEVDGDDDRETLARSFGVSRETYRVQLCRARAQLREPLAA